MHTSRKQYKHRILLAHLNKQMSVPVCQQGCTFFSSVCYCRCPSGTSPANEDPTKCVPDAPTCAVYAVNAGSPGALSDDLIFTLSCTKIRQSPVDGACPSGFTEWQSGSCYINCPSGLIENGLSCLKRPVQRNYRNPVCDNSLYYFNGSDCVMSTSGLLFMIFLIATLLYVGKHILGNNL